MGEIKDDSDFAALTNLNNKSLKISLGLPFTILQYDAISGNFFQQEELLQCLNLYLNFIMLIRLATIDDVPQIMQLVSEVVPLMNASGNFQWDQGYPNPEIFKEDIAHQKLWIAELHGEIAGVSAITTDQDPEYAQVGWNLSETAIVTHRLAVSPHFRGAGVAIALLEKAEQEAVRRGIKTLRVDTNTNNGATQQLFPKMGYVFAGEIGLSYRPSLRFYCYEKRLD